MSGVQDREYQVTARDRVFGEWGRGTASTLLVLPTGTGKTIVAGMVHRKAIDDHGRRGLFIAHREELIRQAVDKLGRFDLQCSVEMGDARGRADEGLLGKPDVVVATVQTLQKKRLESWNPREFGAITIDEAHHARASTYQNVLKHFKDYWLLGITATPDRGDGQNLGATFESLAFEYPLRTAIREGHLVPLVTARLRTSVDLRAIRTTGGDYNQGDLEEAIGPEIEPLARSIVAEVGERPTVVFLPDVGSSELMADALAKLGLPAESVSGKMRKADRRDTLDRFTDGKFQALTCCDLLTEGWDEPQVSCVVICRPTRKRNRYAQMIGRGTRPHPSSGKVDCLIVDFAWETTSQHELCTPIDLFDDSTVDDEVLEAAEQLLKEGAEADPERAIEAADEVVRERRKFRIRLTGRTTKYSKQVFDPVGVGHLVGLPLKQGWDFSTSNPATDRQVEALRNLGVTSPGGLSKQGAGKLLDRLITRAKEGKATVKQVAFLESLGVEEDQARDMGFAQASGTIDALLAAQKAATRKGS